MELKAVNDGVVKGMVEMFKAAMEQVSLTERPDGRDPD
jgi:hypothetical protein